MDNNREDYREARGQRRGYASQYSRSQGVEAYQQRRRMGFATKVLVTLVLVLIVGGAAVLFGRQFFYAVTDGNADGQTPASGAKAGADTPITTVQPATATVVSTGDVILNGAAMDSGRREGQNAYNYVHLFQQLKDEIEPFDLRMVSQETALAGADFGYGSLEPLNAPQDLGRAEVAAGFNVVLRATDHTLDTGTNGLHNELSWWHTEHPDVPVLGVAEPDPQANPGLSDYVSQVYVQDVKGFKVGVLNHTWGVNEEDESAVANLDEEKIAHDVELARKEGAEVIVACPHWGAENEEEISEEQTTYAQVYADLGVDVIFGTHPRVLQSVDVLEGEHGHKTVCFYSLGCLVSGLEENNLLGGLAEVTFDRKDDGTCSVTSAVLKPVVTHRASGDDYAAYLLSDYSDEIAESSDMGARTPGYWSTRCYEILGDEFDGEAGEYRVSL